jgi:hypothetical protein
MWFTLPNANPAQIRSRIAGPAQASRAQPPTQPQPPIQSQSATGIPAAAQAAPVRDSLTEIRPAVRGSHGPSFLGLEVGRSTRADADAVLGAPRQTGTSAEGKRLSTHDGSKVGLREIVVWYAAGDVIDVIALIPVQPASPAELASALGIGKPDRILPYGSSYLHCFDAAGVRFALEGKTVGMVSLTLEQPAASPAGTTAIPPANTASIDPIRRGRELVSQQKYGEAIEYFTNALQLSPKDSYQGLAVCYYHLRDFETADKNAVEAYKRDKKDPVSVFYVGATRDIRNKAREAIYLYKAYLKLRDNNESMNAFARSRLAALEGSSPKSSETLLKALDAIFSQVQPKF